MMMFIILIQRVMAEGFDASLDKESINYSKFTSLTDAMEQINEFWLGGAATFAFIALVWSGLMYITAGGDSAKAEKAKKNLFWER